MAERYPGIFLGRARADDAVPESTGPEQRIPVAALLRFCPGLRSRALARAFHALYAVPLASLGAGHGRAFVPRRDSFSSALVALSFLVRGLLTHYRTGRAFFLRLAGFFFAYAIATNVTLYAFATGNVQEGIWTDLLWTVSYAILIVIAATWDGAEPDPAEDDGPRCAGHAVARTVFSIDYPRDRVSAGSADRSGTVLLGCLSGDGFFRGSERATVRGSPAVAPQFRGIAEKPCSAAGHYRGDDGRGLRQGSSGPLSDDESRRGTVPGPDVDEVIGKDDTELFDYAETGRAIMELDRKVVQSGEMQTYEEGGTAAGVISNLP